MSKELYDILIEGNYFTHSIGKINDKETFKKLESILKLGGLYSKDSLRKMGIQVDGRVAGNIRITKDSYVSLFDPTFPNLEKKLRSAKYSFLFPLGGSEITFLVDFSIELQKNARRSDFDVHEIIVKDTVPFDYLFGIIIPNVEEVIKLVSTLFQQYNIDIPVYDVDGNVITLRNKRV